MTRSAMSCTKSKAVTVISNGSCLLCLAPSCWWSVRILRKYPNKSRSCSRCFYHLFVARTLYCVQHHPISALHSSTARELFILTTHRRKLKVKCSFGQNQKHSVIHTCISSTLQRRLLTQGYKTREYTMWGLLALFN